MSRVVWKESIEYMLGSEAELNLPVGARIVHVAFEPIHTLSFWFECDPTAATERRMFEIIGTGHPIPAKLNYVGTIIDRPLVLHLYEVPVRAISPEESTTT